MININTISKFSDRSYLMYFVSILIPIFFISLLTRSPSASFFMTFISFTLFIGLPIFIFCAVKVNSNSFIVEENNITQNYGILTKRSSTISFDKIQNIRDSSNLMQRMFQLTGLHIWTASPSQTIISKGSSQNTPDVSLLLDSTDAQWLKKYILEKQNKPNTQEPMVQATTI